MISFPTSIPATSTVANGATSSAVPASFVPALVVATTVGLTGLARLGRLTAATTVCSPRAFANEVFARIPLASISTGVEPVATPDRSRDPSETSETLQALEALDMSIFRDSFSDDSPPESATSTVEAALSNGSESPTLEDDSDDTHAPTAAAEYDSQLTVSPVMVQWISYEALCSRSPRDMIKFRQWRSVHLRRMQHPTYIVTNICPDHPGFATHRTSGTARTSEVREYDVADVDDARDASTGGRFDERLRTRFYRLWPLDLAVGNDRFIAADAAARSGGIAL